jgi:hypothetical protein
MSVVNDRLPPAAQSAWSAFTQMELTKQRHFDYLQLLAEKYKKYGQPSAEEAAKLHDLLQAHDAQVQRFKTALQNLRDSDSQAHAALIAHLATPNTAHKHADD